MSQQLVMYFRNNPAAATRFSLHEPPSPCSRRGCLAHGDDVHFYAIAHACAYEKRNRDADTVCVIALLSALASLSVDVFSRYLVRGFGIVIVLIVPVRV